MEAYSIVIILLAIAIGLSSVAKRINFPYPILLLLIACAFLIFLVVLAIRMIVIFYHKISTKRRFDVVNKRLNQFDKEQLERIKQRYPRGKDKLEEYKSLLISTKEAIIIGWSGMRGIISLAAALSLPLVMDNGSVFPHRNTIIFLTVVVVIIMLIVQGLGLPILVKWLKFEKKIRD